MERNNDRTVFLCDSWQDNEHTGKSGKNERYPESVPFAHSASRKYAQHRHATSLHTALCVNEAAGLGGRHLKHSGSRVKKRRGGEFHSIPFQCARPRRRRPPTRARQATSLQGGGRGECVQVHYEQTVRGRVARLGRRMRRGHAHPAAQAWALASHCLLTSLSTSHAIDIYLTPRRVSASGCRWPAWGSRARLTPSAPRPCSRARHGKTLSTSEYDDG